MVKKTYGRIYSFQQQDGCKERGNVSITIPGSNEDYENDSVPEKINGEVMGVSFKAWLARNPKEWSDKDKASYIIDLFWERNISFDDARKLENLFGLLTDRKINTNGSYDVYLTTHLEEKSKLTRGTEAFFNIAVLAVSLPGGLVKKAGETVVEGGVIPITLVSMVAGVTIPAIMIGAASLTLGFSISAIPSAINKIKDHFNGDEKKTAIEMAIQLLSNPEAKIKEIPSVSEVLNNIRQARKVTTTPKIKNQM